MIRFLFLILIVVPKVELCAQCTYEEFKPFYPYFGSKEANIYELADKSLVFLTIGTNDTINPGLNSGDAYQVQVLKTDSCGNEVWRTFIGTAEGNYSKSLVETDSGNILFPAQYGDELGFRIVKINSSGKLQWEKRYLTSVYSAQAWHISKTKNNQFIVDGSIYHTSASQPYPFLMQVDENGNVIRYKEFGSNFKRGRSDWVRHSYTYNDSTFIACFNIPLGTTSLDGIDIAVAEIDTSFNIRKQYDMMDLVYGADTVNKFAYPVSIISSFNKKHLVFTGRLFKKNVQLVRSTIVCDESGNVLSRFDHNDSVYIPDFITHTMDNGYLTFTDKVTIFDSLFQTHRKLNTTFRGTVNVLHHATDRGIVALGSSNYRKVKITDTTYADELYIVKTDSTGYYQLNPYNSINEALPDRFFYSVYPNPAAEVVNISFNKSGLYRIELYNLLGEKKYEVESGEAKIQIGTDAFSNGIYLLRITDIANKSVSQLKLLIRQ